MDQTIEILLLGVLQGIAEFLPISSSGHLIISAAALEEWTGKQLPDFLELNIALHLGTLISILVVYWQRIVRLLSEDRRVIGLVVVATLPAVFVGLPLHEIESLKGLLTSPLLTGWMLMVTGAMLLFGSRRPAGELDYTQLSYKKALTIGVVQAVAILPGISRSGSTIVGGLCTGLRRDAAATFSFLMAIPVTAGAVILEGKDLLTEASAGSRDLWASLPLLLGAVVSFVVGVIALHWLIQWLRAGKLHQFAWWCIPLGAAVVMWQMFDTTTTIAAK